MVSSIAEKRGVRFKVVLTSNGSLFLPLFTLPLASVNRSLAQKTLRTQGRCSACLGTILSLSSWVGACMDIASVFCSLWLASFMMLLGTPTEEMVMWRAPMPTFAVRNLLAASTERMLSRGSPGAGAQQANQHCKVWGSMGADSRPPSNGKLLQVALSACPGSFTYAHQLITSPNQRHKNSAKAHPCP
jgi:hypothetical protein